MKSEYCVVGPKFALIGEGDKPAADELTLDVEAHRGEVVARLSAVLRDREVVQMHEPHSVHQLGEADIAELVRLFARVCADFWAYRFPLEIEFVEAPPPTIREALSADGFSARGGALWFRPAVLFPVREPKARTMEEVYQDLFSVPWNFVPREWDVCGPMLAEAPTTDLAVLDLGCGLGKNVGPFEARGFSVYGVDPAYAAVRRCRDIVAHPKRFIVGTATGLPWRDGCFNRVLDIGSLHCMRAADRRIAVLEIARVLSAGGLLYSRFFKPRGLAWVQRQPMQVDHFGLTLDEVGSLLDGPLVCESVREDASVIYAKARKR
jgi:hypothetical protein